MVEETGDLVGCQIAEKVTTLSCLIGYPSAQRYEKLIGAPRGIPKEKYILQEIHRQIINELKLL